MQVLTKETAILVKQQVNGAADTDKVIFEGNIIPRAQANAEIERREIAARPNSIDPQDLIDACVSNQHLKYKLRSSLAWSIDMACINAARNIFFAMRASNGVSIDDFNEFINDIAAMKADEAYRAEFGHEENTGVLQSLAIMLNLRSAWHGLAAPAAKAIGLKYEPKELEEYMAKEEVRTLNEDVTVNLESLAHALTRKTPERYEQVLKLMKESQEKKYKKQHDTRVITAPAVSNIFAIAETRMFDQPEVQFNQLPNALQHRLISGVKAAAERSLTDLADWKGVTTTAYAMLCVEAFDLIDKVDEILANAE